ncbi:hypothetical protein PFISCL1PPCAC_6689, partial [Pristionchus fissidentatus]
AMSKRGSDGDGGPPVKKEVVCEEESNDELESAKKEIARLKKFFEGACREARKEQLRAEEAESRLDQKPVELVALRKRNIELLEKNTELCNEVYRLKSEAIR